MRTEFPPIAQCIDTPYIVSVNNELPVRNLKVNGASVLALAAGSEQVLAYFRGEAPAPAT